MLWVSVCSLRYPARNARKPYCHQYPVRLYNNFPHYLTKGHDFQNTILSTKCVFLFCLQLLSETFLILRRIKQHMIKNVYRFSCKVPLLFLSDFNKTWIFSTNFRKILKYQISWNSFQREPNSSMRTDIRTDRHDETNKRFSQFYERA